jgi:MYXO-CTERM domain-containing protein
MSLAGIPSQISKGGVALDVAGELDAVYQTDRIRIEPATDPLSNEPPITSQEGTTTRAFAGGPFVEYDVWPEGRVSYTGTLHLIPTLFIEVLGQDFDMPIFDFPVSMPIGDQDFVFDPVRVHVPLPDLAPVTPEVLSFGDVNIGDGRILTLTLENNGEAKARANGFVESEMAEVFTLTTPEVLVDPSGGQGVVKVRFEPDTEGEFETELTLVTNDPDTRFQTVVLRGNGVTSGAPVYGDNDPERITSDNDGTCGCATPGSSGSSGALGLLGIALALGLARRSIRHAV